jgi:hypothetical protein
MDKGIVECKEYAYDESSFLSLRLISLNPASVLYSVWFALVNAVGEPFDDKCLTNDPHLTMDQKEPRQIAMICSTGLDRECRSATLFNSWTILRGTFDN